MRELIRTQYHHYLIEHQSAIFFPKNNPILFKHSGKVRWEQHGKRIITLDNNNKQTVMVHNLYGNRVASLLLDEPQREALISASGKHALILSAEMGRKLTIWHIEENSTDQLEFNDLITTCTWAEKADRFLVTCLNNSLFLYDKNPNLIVKNTSQKLGKTFLHPLGTHIFIQSLNRKELKWLHVASNQKYRLQHADVDKILFDERGDITLTCAWSRHAFVWDLLKGKRIQIPTPHPHEVCLSSTGKTIITTSHPSSVSVWDTSSLTQPILHLNDACQAFFTPDGSNLITINNTITLKNLEGSTIHRFEHPTAFGVCCSCDGIYLLTLGYDNHARLWNLKTGKQYCTFPLKNPGPTSWHIEHDHIILKYVDAIELYPLPLIHEAQSFSFKQLALCASLYEQSLITDDSIALTPGQQITLRSFKPRKQAWLKHRYQLKLDEIAFKTSSPFTDENPRPRKRRRMK